MMPDGYAGQFRLRCWPDARRETAPYEVSTDGLPALRENALSLLAAGGYGYIELSVWNIELNDWVRMETLARPGISVPKA